MSEQNKPDKATAPASPATDSNALQPKLDLPSIEAPAIQPSIDTRIETPPLDAPPVAPIPALERIKRKNAKRAPAEEAASRPAPSSETEAAATGEAAAPARSSKFALLAASVAIAAAIGALIGGLAGPAPATVAPQAGMSAEEARALRDGIAQIKTELGALRTALEAGTRNSSTQFTKMGERFDRVERAQAAPAATLTKAVEALDRIERRTQTGSTAGTPANAAPDVTGSVAAQPASAPVPQARPAVVEGWVVRDVYRGVAVLQGRRLGIIEVEAGDSIPGVGRIESIKRQDGRWVVVTPKGLITSATR